MLWKRGDYALLRSNFSSFPQYFQYFSNLVSQINIFVNIFVNCCCLIFFPIFIFLFYHFTQKKKKKKKKKKKRFDISCKLSPMHEMSNPFFWEK